MASAGGLVAAAAGAWLLLRHPWVLAFATLACIPIRIPFDIGEERRISSSRCTRSSARSPSLSPGSCSGETTASASSVRSRGRSCPCVGWTGLALLWTDDLRQGAIFLAAFVLPFGLLAVGFARLPQPPSLARPLGALVATALAYAGIGLYQWATREVFWNPKLRVDNAYAPFFRVNSVFWDPSIYGRYLVVAILATLARVLLGCGTGPRRRCSSRSSRSGTASCLVLAVELRRADRGHARGRRPDWRWRAAAASPCRGRRRLGRLAPPAGAPRAAAGARQGLTRSRAAVAGLAGNGLRIAVDHPVLGVGRQLQARVCREDRSQGRGAEESGVALDTRDSGRRDGRAGARAALAGWASSRWQRPFAAAAGRTRDARHSSRRFRLARSPCTASSTTRSSRIRPCGRCSA